MAEMFTKFHSSASPSERMLADHGGHTKHTFWNFVHFSGQFCDTVKQFVF